MDVHAPFLEVVLPDLVFGLVQVCFIRRIAHAETTSPLVGEIPNVTPRTLAAARGVVRFRERKSDRRAVG
jgi:hypothetical protein